MSRRLVPNSAPSFTTLLVIALFAFTACSRNAGLPAPGSKEYRDLVSAFYVGLAGLQTGEDVYARNKLTLATQIAPGEPAGWANLGLFAVRQQEFDAAYENVEKARSLAPDNSQIAALLGLIESKRGKLPEAIAHLNKAVELDPKNLKARYALAQETERQATETSDAEAQRLLEKILEIQPGNLAVLIDVTRLAAKRGDAETLKRAVATLAEKSSAWPDEAKQRLSELQQAAGENPRAAATQSAFLRNLLLRVPEYRQSLNAVRTPAEYVGDPFMKFIKLPSPSSDPALPDLAMTFDVQPIQSAPEGKVRWIGAIPLAGEGNPSILWVDETGVQIAGGPTIPFSGGKKLFSPDAPVSRNGVLGIDLNYDFKTDLVLAGAGGIRIYQQENLGKFTDITMRAKLPDNIINGSYLGAWAIDVDLDGDLDVILGAIDGKPQVVRNNGDGSFSIIEPFAGVTNLSSYSIADTDGDGDPDVAMVDTNGQLSVFINERFGQYRQRSLPQSLGGGFKAVNSGDIDSDGLLDFVAVREDGTVFRLSDKDAGGEWEIAELVKAEPDSNSLALANLLIGDFDNNGALDLLVGFDQLFLSNGQGRFSRLDAKPEFIYSDIVDVNGDGRLDLIGLSGADKVFTKPTQLVNRSTKNYHYQTIRTHAAHTTGNQRINSFGIGGEIEIRSGLLTQKQVITSPVLHFGLGENTQTDVARIVWPTGTLQAEFELKADQSILAEQRLKGSCPMLFAWDGERISFVKDTAPMTTSLGMRANAREIAPIYRTEEWFKIPGGKLAPRAGFYDLRVTAELWEVYYIDHYSLLVVDHPPGTEVFADERFAAPPPPLKLYAVKTPKPFASARDDRGQDVSAVVRELDENYLGGFGKGRYQGVTRDHWVELELPQREGPPPAQLYLIGHGFLQPTDSSINVAYSQSGYPPPQGLSIETPSAEGKWLAAKTGLGFPAGKMKTVVLDLNNIFRSGAPRKLRLRTNLEIYWDKLEWAEGLPETTYKTQRAGLSSAELRYRGFSKFTRANDSSPELPDYNQLAGTGQKWRNLTGYYTRHGEARELLEKVDDRMVIVGAGDELRLKFAAPPPPAGWARDYVMVGDGWIKEGDLNTTFSQTALPLPYHGMKDYTAAPGRLEDSPAYKRHPVDWQKYHTRYVTPDAFVQALRGR
jgi:tetratricopeptide (TPR) repeat protein